jgi:type II secretory pathway component PulF
MPGFIYKARDASGKLERGTVEAPSQQVATNMLRDRGYIILSLDQSSGSISDLVSSILNRIPTRVVVIFSRQLATMIDASLPIAEALRVMMKQTENEHMRKLILKITADVEGGAELSVALSQFPEVFTDFYVSVIRSGETSGRLPESMLYLADYLERDYELKSKIRSAIIYPVFLIGAMAVVAVIAMIYVIPQLTTVFEGVTVELPLSTRILISMSNYFLYFWWLNLLFLGVIGVGIWFYIKSEAGRWQIDKLKLRVPIFSSIYQKIVMARFSQTLSTLIRGGIPIVRSLYIVSDVLNNRIYEEIILDAGKEIEDGNPFNEVLKSHKEIPPMVSQLIGVGERTGKLEEVLDRLASFYSKEVENSLNNLVSILEPVILVIMGVGVGLLFSAIILPIYNLASSF